jgi:hypothetical protein
LRRNKLYKGPKVNPFLDQTISFTWSVNFWWESQKERDHWEDQDVDGWTILKWILER